MALTASPFGMAPVRMLGSRPYNAGINEYRHTANSPNPIFSGSPVSLVLGQVVAITGSPSNVAGANTPIGVFLGCEYTDPVSQKRVYAQFLPANAFNTFGAAGRIMLKVADDPDLVFKVQADGSVAYAALGRNAALVSFAGNTATGLSNMRLQAASVAGTASLAVRIVGFTEGDGVNTPGDAFTECLVMWNEGVHALRNGTGQ